MKKSDLIAGKHVIETYGGERHFVCGDYLLSKNGELDLLDDYNFDVNSYFKIVKVYEIKQNRNLVNLMNNDNLKLVWERREKLTDFERQILGYLIYRFKYIARDEDDSLYAYNQEVEKHISGWEIDEYEVGVSRMGDLTVFDLLFPMIKWSDEEPTLISDLLNGCD